MTWEIAIVPIGRIFVMDSGGKTAEVNILVPSSVQGYRPNIRSLRWLELEVGEGIGVWVGVGVGTGVTVGVGVGSGVRMAVADGVAVGSGVSS